jgi:hypothetical protein
MSTVYRFSTVLNETNPIVTPRLMGLDELRELLTPKPGEKEGEAFIPALFKPCPPICRNHGTKKYDCKGRQLHRLAENVIAMTALVVDLDNGTLADFENHLARLRRMELEVFWHETYSSTPTNFKGRIIIFFDEPCPVAKPEDWSQGMWPKLMHYTGFATAADKACRDASHFYYDPRCPNA